MVERRPEEPGVAGSSPALPTKKCVGMQVAKADTL